MYLQIHTYIFIYYNIMYTCMKFIILRNGCYHKNIQNYVKLFSIFLVFFLVFSIFLVFD